MGSTASLEKPSDYVDPCSPSWKRPTSVIVDRGDSRRTPEPATPKLDNSHSKFQDPTYSTDTLTAMKAGGIVANMRQTFLANEEAAGATSAGPAGVSKQSSPARSIVPGRNYSPGRNSSPVPAGRKSSNVDPGIIDSQSLLPPSLPPKRSASTTCPPLTLPVVRPRERATLGAVDDAPPAPLRPAPGPPVPARNPILPQPQQPAPANSFQA